MYFYKYKKLMRSLGQGVVMPPQAQIQAKNRLLAEIRSSAEWKQAVFYTPLQRGWNWQGIGTITLVLALVLGGGSIATISKARASLPGEALYGVKITMEKAQVSLAFSREKQAELEMSFASTRLDEVSTLIAQDGNTSQVAKHVSQAMDRFNRSLDSVQKKLDSAKSQADKTDAKSLAVVVAKSGSEESLVKLQGKIENIEKKIDQIKVDNADNSHKEAIIKEAKAVLEQDSTITSESLSIIKEPGENTPEATKNIDDAKEILESQDLAKYQEILVKFETTKALVQATQETIDTILDK